MGVRFKEDIVSEINKKFQRWRMFKLPFEGNFFLNIAFYYGYQWTVYNVATGELNDLANMADRIRITSNQIQPRVRNLLAKMTKNHPIEEIQPRGWTERKLYSAEISRELLAHFREIHNEDTLDSASIMWLLLCGDVFRKIGFDPTAGDQQMERIGRAEAMLSAGGGETEGDLQGLGVRMGNKRTTMAVGEVFDDVIPPFEIFVPDYATYERPPNEILHVKLVPVDEIRDKWGSKAAKVKAQDRLQFSNMFQQRLLGMASPEFGSSVGISRLVGEAASQMCYVFEMWKKPSKQFPKGRVTIVAGDNVEGLLYDAPNPYYDAIMSVRPLRFTGGIPIIKIGCIDAPGRYWQISPVEGMRPLQVEYNKTITDMTANRATVGRNKIIAPKSAKMDADEVANTHGQFLEFSGVTPPSIFPAMPLPQQVERETERNRQDLDTISGSHEVSRAQAPSGIKSGIAINYLLEQDDTTLAPIVRNYERAKRHTAMMKLAIAKAYYADVRVIDVTNVESTIEVAEFVGSDIETSVKVVPGSALPQSRAALQAMYLDLYERMAIVDETGRPDPKRLFELLKQTMPIEALATEENLDISRAKRENIQLAQGAEILPKHWENHIVHIREHNKFRKTDRFYRLPPVIMHMFDQHVMIHADLLAPPIPTPSGMAGVIGAEMADGGGGGGNGDMARMSPTAAGGGSAMGTLNNPPSNRGGTIAGA